MEERIIARINDEIGNDFQNLHRASLLAKQYKEQLQSIANNLNYEHEDNVSSYKSTFHCQQQAAESFDFEMEKLEQFSQKLKSKIKESTNILNSVKVEVQQIRRLQRMAHYLRIIQDIQIINESLKNAISGNDEAKMVNIYLTLYEQNDNEHSVVGRLNNVEAPALRLFAINTSSYWYTVLKQRFSTEFEKLLKNMRWLPKDQTLLNYSPTRDISKAQLLAEYLFTISSPIEEEELPVTITSSIVCQPFSQVTKLLLTPYRQRFIFHFTGTKQTNRLDKPEWFFTQIINWAKETHLFVGKTFQPSVVKAGRLNFNLRLDFIRGLVQLAIEKMVGDIEIISEDENLFAHLLDETLAFEAELRELFGYPPSFPSAISVFTQPVYLLKWISLEERFCEEKMDDILLAENPWQLIDPNSIEDDLKIPKCADQFMRLLDAIKDRYYSLIQPGHQLQFLSLQLGLIDSFRRRLVQMLSNGVVKTIPIMNTINYIIMALREWGENIHYLHLHTALVGPKATEINSVFENPVNELEDWMARLLNSLTTKVMNEVKAKSMHYRHDAWSAIPEQNSKEPFFLSTSAGEMFQVLVNLLHNLERDLSANIFNKGLRLIAHQIDNFMLDSMIMNTKFSPAGAAQFNYDMTRNLFPLFGQYTRRPDLLFKKINDSIKILTATRGTALLLHETLKSKQTQNEKQKPLKELGILSLKAKTCIEILERRTDIRII